MNKSTVLPIISSVLGLAFAAGAPQTRITTAFDNIRLMFCSLIPTILMLSIIVGAILFPILIIAAGALYYMGLKNAESKAKFHGYAKKLAICALIIASLPVIALIVFLAMPYIVGVLMPGSNLSC
jgi:uncharacterized membrane protein YidH (DUF202 family)